MSKLYSTPSEVAQAILAAHPERSLDFAFQVTVCVSQALTMRAVAASRVKPLTAEMDGVIAAVCAFLPVTKSELLGKSKLPRIVRPRHMLWALLKSELLMGDHAIAARVGSDHSTIRHGRERVDCASNAWLELREHVRAAMRLSDVAEAAE